MGNVRIFGQRYFRLVSILILTKIILKSLILFSVNMYSISLFRNRNTGWPLLPLPNFHLLIPIPFVPFSLFCFSFFPPFNFYPDFIPTFFLSFPCCSSYFSCISGCWLFFFGGFLLVLLFPYFYCLFHFNFLLCIPYLLCSTCPICSKCFQASAPCLTIPSVSLLFPPLTSSQVFQAPLLFFLVLSILFPTLAFHSFRFPFFSQPFRLWVFFPLHYFSLFLACFHCLSFLLLFFFLSPTSFSPFTFTDFLCFPLLSNAFYILSPIQCFLCLSPPFPSLFSMLFRCLLCFQIPISMLFRLLPSHFHL